MSAEEIVKAQQDLLDLLRAVNGIETRCRHLRAPVAVPKAVYEHIGAMRNEIARWGIENIARAGGEDATI